MPINGVPVPLTSRSPEAIANAAPPIRYSLVPGNPPELILCKYVCRSPRSRRRRRFRRRGAEVPYGRVARHVELNNPTTSSKSHGPFTLQNDTDSVIPVPANTVLRRRPGQQYTIGLCDG